MCPPHIALERNCCRGWAGSGVLHGGTSWSGGIWALEWAVRPFPAVALCALGLCGFPGEQGHLLFLWLFLSYQWYEVGDSFQASAADPSLAAAVDLAVIQG